MKRFLTKTTTGLMILAFSQAMAAQKTYAFHWHTDLSLTGAVLVNNTASYAIGQHIEPLKPADIATLNRYDVCSLDRKTTSWL